MPREDVLATRDSDALGSTLAAAAGLMLGLAAGIALGGLAGDLHRDGVRRIVRRLRGRAADPERDPAELAREVRAELRRAQETRAATIDVHAVGPGLLELTGSAPDAITRLAAGDMARMHPGVDVVVNRILVLGSDLPPRPHASKP